MISIDFLSSFWSWFFCFKFWILNFLFQLLKSCAWSVRSKFLNWKLEQKNQDSKSVSGEIQKLENLCSWFKILILIFLFRVSLAISSQVYFWALETFLQLCLLCFDFFNHAAELLCCCMGSSKRVHQMAPWIGLCQRSLWKRDDSICELKNNNNCNAEFFGFCRTLRNVCFWFFFNNFYSFNIVRNSGDICYGIIDTSYFAFFNQNCPPKHSGFVGGLISAGGLISYFFLISFFLKI